MMLASSLRCVGPAHAAAGRAGCARPGPVRVAPQLARRAPLVTTRLGAAATEPAPVAEAVPEATPSGPKTAVAHLRFQRGSVFKIRRVLDTIRGRSYEEALVLMEYMPYKACESIVRVLLSAAANAKHNKGALKTKLVVSECFADGGPYLKRFRPRAKGRGFKILKPTFHLTIRVEEKDS